MSVIQLPVNLKLFQFFTVLYTNTHIYEYAWYLGKIGSNIG